MAKRWMHWKGARLGPGGLGGGFRGRGEERAGPEGNWQQNEEPCGWGRVKDGGWWARRGALAGLGLRRLGFHKEVCRSCLAF